MNPEMKIVQLDGETVTNLYRDLGRNGYSKEDFYQELFGEETEKFLGDPKYGSADLSKRGVLEIAKQLGFIVDYDSRGYGTRYTVKFEEGEEFRPAMNKSELEKKIAERCGFEFSGSGFGKADLFDIVHTIQMQEEVEN